jgi:predicted transcriptional regulator
LDRTILLLLLAMPTYPYDLHRQLVALGHACGTGRTVHYHVKLLTQDGLVASAWETPQNGGARLIYSITGGYGLFATCRRSTMTVLAVGSNDPITIRQQMLVVHYSLTK